MEQNIPYILKGLRKKKCLTQADVAKVLGLSTNAYQSYERGTSEPGCRALNILADFYGVTTDYLLGREPLPDPFADLELKESTVDEVYKMFKSLPEVKQAIAMDILLTLSEVVRRSEQCNKNMTMTAGGLEDLIKAEREAHEKDAG